MERSPFLDGLPWIHPVSTLTTLHAQLLRELQRHLVWVVVRLPQRGKPVHLPSSLHGDGWPSCVYREPARKHKGRGGTVSTYPPTSFWLSLLALPEAKKGWEFGKVKVYHYIYLPLCLILRLRKRGWTFFLHSET